MCSIRLKQERVIATEQNVNVVNSDSVEIVNYKMAEEEEKR